MILWDEVGEAEGTGIVHIAPGCGAEDFQLGKEHGLPVVAPLDEDGVISWTASAGSPASTCREVAAADLRGPAQERACSTASSDYTHRYPVCWRCGDRAGLPPGGRVVHQHG